LDQFYAKTSQLPLFLVFILAAAILIAIYPSLSFMIGAMAEQAQPYNESTEMDNNYNIYGQKENDYGNDNNHYKLQFPPSYEPEYYEPEYYEPEYYEPEYYEPENKSPSEIDNYSLDESTYNNNYNDIEIQKRHQQEEQKLDKEMIQPLEEQTHKGKQSVNQEQLVSTPEEDYLINGESQQQEQLKVQVNEDNSEKNMFKKNIEQKLEDSDEQEKEDKEDNKKSNSETSYQIDPRFRSFFPL
jgi:hypothetical protein